MQKPMFIATSKGYINLSLVTQITEHGGKMRFVFIGSMSTGDEGMMPDYLELDHAEGSGIVSLLRENFPEMFIG